ncbi:PH domain-containing protein [Oricola cellulosilytica]|uniref:PH domain-containing protein n=1 Tax=Oricola cellulosilytica TaxID=1429082 RepID=A0A4R0PDU4_9HYPH|nr:PH domain-containing protein [Oricola cellulosilytica]TCD14923.1 PH domain-containing protein [Oricola cellulosilytica]
MSDVLYRANPPMFRNGPISFIVCVLLIPAFGLGIILLLGWYIQSKSKLLEITESRLRFEQGILNKKYTEISNSSVRSVQMSQSFFQRMFGTGDLAIFTAGDSPEIVVKGMPDPDEIRTLLSG